MRTMLVLLAVLSAGLLLTERIFRERAREVVPPGRREVVFWHFWGGRYKQVVEEIADRFNASQNEHFVRPIAMPGKNLDLKFFLSVAGEDPPDVLNQDDPIVADFAQRGVLTPLDELAGEAEYQRLQQWLFPAAKELATYNDRLYALCNGLDIRALYYDATYLEQHGLEPPRTLEELDRLAFTIAPPHASGPRERFGYLPDPRRLWAWGIVFGGRFYDSATGELTLTHERIVDALEWMAKYKQAYGAATISAFRKGDQALTGASSPLLQGRYVLLMDGQWRVAEIAEVQAAAAAAGRPVPQYGVIPLPPPPGGLQNAGWVNGNFFVVPRGAKNPEGAWQFMKFWAGFEHEASGAWACAAGGWIPASQQVVDEPEFQQYLADYPMFRTFVELAGSPHQQPTPVIPGAQRLYAEVIRVAEETLYRPHSPPARQALEQVERRLRSLGK